MSSKQNNDKNNKGKDPVKEKNTPKDESKVTLKDGNLIDVLNIDTEKEVSNELKKRSKGAKELFVESLANDELQERQKLLAKAFEDYENKLKELKDIKPDVQGGVAKDGKVFPDHYSKEKFNEYQKTYNHFNNVKEAIEVAWEKDDFSKLKNIYNDKKKK